MAKLYEVQELVYRALVDNPTTRSDDFILILEVLSNYCDKGITLEGVIRNHKELGIPSFETITRARRKIQETHKELIDEKAKKVRKEEEKDFKEYALNY